MSNVARKHFFAYKKIKEPISCTVMAQLNELISAFVLATQIVQSLYFLNLKFKSLAIFSSCTAWFVMGLGRNPEDRFSHDVAQMSVTVSLCYHKQLRQKMSRVMRNSTFCICENKDADQLCSNREADQRLCFRYIDSTIPLLSKYEISSL